MVQDGTGRFKAVSNVLLSERSYEHFVGGGQKNLSQGLVGAVVLVEECVQLETYKDRKSVVGL